MGPPHQIKRKRKIALEALIGPILRGNLAQRRRALLKRAKRGDRL